MAPRIPEKQLARARRLRRDITATEDILWRSLRGRGIGAKFRRQVPIGSYVVDFACIDAKLIVEIDGPSHDDPGQQARDLRRDAWFARNGWRVLRLSNALVTGGGNIPLDMIRKEIAAASPSSDLR